MDASKVAESLASKFQELEMVWKEARETPRRNSGNQSARQQETNARLASPVKNTESASSAARPEHFNHVRDRPVAVPVERKPSAQRMQSNTTNSPSVTRVSPSKASVPLGVERALSRTSPARTTSPSARGKPQSIPKRLESPTAARRQIEPVTHIPKPSSPVPHHIDEGPKFCRICGFDLRSCKVPPKFCRECGTKVEQ